MEGITNCRFLAVCPFQGEQEDLGIIEQAAIVWREDTIVWVGKAAALPGQYRDAALHDAEGRLALPGLIDCHTHLAFGGWREHEFVERILGKSYLEILQGGGGISSTVHKTRAASRDELLRKCRVFLTEMSALGVTTVECKSGYGLSLQGELAVLRLYQELASQTPLTVMPTFLGLHTVPPEFREKRAEYLRLVCEEMLPAIARERLALFCDAFVEQGAFHVEEAEAVLRRAAEYGLVPKVHADQLTSAGGALLAARLKAASADHLEHAPAEALDLLAGAGVVGVVLPFCSLYTHEHPVDARRLLQRGVHVAVATDFNPGTAPSYHLPFALMLACTLNRLTPAEAIKGATIYAARALRCETERGSLEPGKKADIALVEAENFDHWLYHLRPNACVLTIKNGRRIFQR